MRTFVLIMASALTGAAYAGVTQTLEMRLSRSPSDPSVHVIEVVTTIATDSKFPDRLELQISPPPGFVGLKGPHLDGRMVITAPTTPDATEDGKELEATCEPENWRWLIAPGEARAVRMRYRVPLTFDREIPQSSRLQHILPYVTEDYGMIGTLMTTATAINARPDRVLARITTPDRLGLISPWPIARDASAGGVTWYDVPPEAIGGYEFLPVGGWIGPDLAIGEFQVRMIFPPEWASVEQRLREPLETIVRYGSRLFGSEMRDTFVFAFRPSELGAGSISATTATNSISFVLDPDVLQSEPESVVHTIAHEFVHLWSRRTLAIGEVSDMRWLHEGFTDYYASQICFRTGLMSRESFERALAERSRTAASTPVRWSITAAGAKGMDGDEASTQLTYSGGWLLGAWLDAAIRSESIARGRSADFAPAAGDVAKPGTLDEFMRDFYNDPRWNERVRPTAAMFLERLVAYLPAERIARFAQFTAEPWAFDTEAAFRELGVPVARTRIAADRMGIVLGPGSTIVQDLQAGGPAAAFGVELGDAILCINGIPIASSADLRGAWRKSGGGETEMVVRRAGVERTLRGDKPLVEHVRVDPSLLLR